MENTEIEIAVLKEQAKHNAQQFARMEQQFARMDEHINQTFAEIRRSLDALRAEMHTEIRGVSTKLYWVIGIVTLLATTQLLMARQLFSM